MTVSETFHPSMDPHLPRAARVLGNVPLVETYHLLQLSLEDEAPHEWVMHRPGQFVMASAIGVGEAPFTIASSPTRSRPLELVVHAVGPVTQALCASKENTLVGLRGPFGNGYPVETLVGADLLVLTQNPGSSFARSLLWYALDRRQSFGTLSLIYETPDPSRVVLARDLSAWVVRRDLTTVVTTLGNSAPDWPYSRGAAADHLRKLDIVPKNTYVALCGTAAFYRENGHALVAMGFSRGRILIALARRMRCGTGVCGHCKVGSKNVCLDGPVFTYWDASNLPEVM